MIKAVVGESDANRELLQKWIDLWEPRAHDALKPLAQASVGVEALDEVRAELSARLKKFELQSRGVSA
jgi:phenol hydroxylase P1 protein